MEIILDLDKVKKRAKKEYDEDNYKKFCNILEEEYILQNMENVNLEKQRFISEIKECMLRKC